MSVALVTGGGSVIGVGVSRVLMEDGWTVVLADLSATNLEKARDELRGSGEVETLQVDVTDLAGMQSAVRSVELRRGSVGALVTAAGGQEGLRGKSGVVGDGPARRTFLDMDPAEWSIILEANLTGVMNACYAVLPGMLSAGRGSVVSIASGAGVRARARASIYSASKAGVIKFVQAVAQELAPTGVRLNCVLPGTTDARWRDEHYVNERPSPMGVPTHARDVGNAVAFLVSTRASHITGTCIDTSGGATLY